VGATERMHDDVVREIVHMDMPRLVDEGHIAPPLAREIEPWLRSRSCIASVLDKSFFYQDLSLYKTKLLPGTADTLDCLIIMCSTAGNFEKISTIVLLVLVSLLIVRAG
jgi:hypothetical protein